MRHAGRYVWRVGLAGVVYAAIAVASRVVLRRYQDLPASPAPVWEMAAWLLLGGLLTAVVLAVPAARSRWSGTQLMVAVFVPLFGLSTFLNIAQGWLLVPALVTFPLAALWLAHGFLVAVFFSFFVVLIMGRLHPPGLVAESTRLHLPPLEWLWKLGLCLAALTGTCAVVLQWLTPRDVAEFYRGMGLAPLWQSLVFEVGRALMLVAFVLPIIKMTKGDRLEAALTTAFLMAVLCSLATDLIPSADVPDKARYFRMASGGGSHFLFGLLVGYLFSRRPF